MTQEDKELLKKDLYARLPYKVKVHIEHDVFYDEREPYDTELDLSVLYNRCAGMEIKPYLRPLSSMMQGEWEEMTAIIYPYGRVNINPDNKNELLLWLSAEGNEMPIILINNVFSWLNKHHFDYNGLIEKGLALEAPKNMYKFE